jgi:hypothetical protein
MKSSNPTVFVNSSKEGIARVKAGDYAYLMESLMLEYYMGQDCELQTVGGLLDSKVCTMATASYYCHSSYYSISIDFRAMALHCPKAPS